MMFTPHQADAVRRALRKGLDQEGPPSQGLDGRLRDALADTGRARFTADQKDDVRAPSARSTKKRTSAWTSARRSPGPRAAPRPTSTGPPSPSP